MYGSRSPVDDLTSPLGARGRGQHELRPIRIHGTYCASCAALRPWLDRAAPITYL
ncbi:hypothetical protein BGY98DRAFT_1019209 [Russula aff. rugulosa BPL654]|nr:hypothetical protein BGY98DRAFT_1019209 [Russula aff. rugulosa BPL654]